MKISNTIKKFNKTYSIVIIPNSNDSVRKLSVKAPLIKLFFAILLFTVIVTSTIFIEAQNKAGKDARLAEASAAEKASNTEMQKQVETLSRIIDDQNKALSLNQSYLDQLKSSDAATKAKIQEFTKLYADIADNYISKTSRSSATKNANKTFLDLTELSHIVKDLNSFSGDDQQISVRLKETAEKLDSYAAALPTLIPAKGKITSPFGYRKHPIKKVTIKHQGIDISASKGDPILAAGAGVVEFAGYSSGFGYNVLIDHKNGYKTRYGHSSKLFVKEGEVVKKGQKIALVGSTGLSTGPHLHFEVRIGNTPVDPTDYVDFK